MKMLYLITQMLVNDRKCDLKLNKNFSLLNEIFLYIEHVFKNVRLNSYSFKLY